MKVRMLVGIAGTVDGTPWPERGGIIDLADHVAADLVSNRYAEPVIETAAADPVTETASRPAGRPRKAVGA